MSIKTGLIIGIILIIISLSDADAISQADIISDHGKPIPICYYCHVEKGYSIGGFSSEEQACDNCHTIKDDIQLLDSKHSQICSKCHNSPNNPQEYHQTHKNVVCDKCHGTGKPVKPDISMNNCAGCHGTGFNGGESNIHITHKTRLEEICTRCHGTRPSVNPSGISDLKSPTIEKQGIKQDIIKEVNKVNEQVYAKVIDYKKFTIYDMLEKLFKSF